MFATAIFVMGMVVGVAITGAILYEPMPDSPWQAALYINNWTNTTLDLEVFVVGSEWMSKCITLEHTMNVTLTVSWYDTELTYAFIHAIGEEIDGWLVYTLEPGEWKTVMLI